MVKKLRLNLFELKCHDVKSRIALQQERKVALQESIQRGNEELEVWERSSGSHPIAQGATAVIGGIVNSDARSKKDDEIEKTDKAIIAMKEELMKWEGKVRVSTVTVTVFSIIRVPRLSKWFCLKPSMGNIGLPWLNACLKFKQECL